MSHRLIAAAGRGSGFTGTATYNDEFDGNGSDWTVWPGLADSGADFGVTQPGRVHMKHGTIITRPRIPAFPFTMEAYCASITYDNINTTPGNATLGLGLTPTDSAHGAFYGLEWDIDTPGFIGQFDGKFVPMFGAQPVHFGTITNNTAGTVNQVPHWQKMVAHSASNIDLYWTKTGTLAGGGTGYTPYGSAFNPGITMDCLYIVSFACITEWEYVRFT